MSATTAVLIVVALIIGAVVGYLVARLSAATRLAEARGRIDSLAERNTMLEARVSDSVEIAALLGPVQESLTLLHNSARASSDERAKAEATLVEQMATVRQHYASLQAATSQIAAAMAKGQTRGQWGEMQLEQLLSHAGLIEGVHFLRQDSRDGAAGSSRPDVVIKLAGGGQLLIDAKFPFDAYWAACGVADPGERDALLNKHAMDVLARATELSRKGYSDIPDSPDFVVMFLPLESLLSDALDMDGLLLEKTFARNVVVATPTTLLALLRTIVYGYQRFALAENTEAIRAAGSQMLDRLGILAEHLGKVGKGLGDAVNAYNSFVGSFERNAMSSARRMRDLGVTTPKSLDAPAEIAPPAQSD